MQKKSWLVLTVLLVSALLLAACPGRAEPAAPAAAPPAADEEPASEAAEDTTPTEAAEEETADEAAAPATGETGLIIWADDTRAGPLTELGARFEEQYGIGVVVTEKGFDQIRDDFKVRSEEHTSELQ